MLKELNDGIGREIQAVIVQKTGILLVVVADAICAAYLGELASFGRVTALLTLMTVITSPWSKVSVTEGALALRDNYSRASRLFGAYVLDPLYIVLVASAFIAIQVGWATECLGEEAASYLRWALVAKSVGHLPLAGIKALRKSGNTKDIIASTWTLAIINLVGNALAIYHGWGMRGLAISWALSELVAGSIPVVRAYRRGLLSMPTWVDVCHVASLTPPLYKAAIPGAAVCTLRAVVFAVTPASILTPFIAATQGYEAANNLSSQLAKVGVAATQRGAEGAYLAYKWSWLVRIGAAPIAWYIGGVPAVVMIVFGHYALFAFCKREEVADYVGHSMASMRADIVWACLIGIALAIDAGGIWWLFAARYAQQLSYYLFAR